MDNNKSTLKILHISDLHRGQDRSEIRWGNVREDVHRDIERHANTYGLIDLVVFSGDITYRGEKTEFDSVLHELQRLWGVFRQNSMNPRLVVVPGNHDLERPPAHDPLVAFASLMRTRTSVKDELFRNKNSGWYLTLSKAFSNYLAFLDDLRSSQIDLLMDVEGWLPGDFSGRFEINGLKVGVVGLNSAWTHLEGGDLSGKLDIYPEQLGAVVGGDLPSWSKNNNVSIVVTHHPVDWFNDEAQRDFNGEIYREGIFDAHLYGHMHESKPVNINIGAHNRKNLQAPSLYGLEKYRGEMTRHHGYSFVEFNAEKSVLEFWPRVFREKRAGGIQVVADSDILDGDDKSFVWPWKVTDRAGVLGKK